MDASQPSKLHVKSETGESLIKLPIQKGKVAEKLKNAAPYNFFLITVIESTATHTDPLSISFQELFDPSLGNLESTVQISCCVDIDWLMAEYTEAKIDHLPLLLLSGSEEEDWQDIDKRFSNVNAIQISVPFPTGCHHTKLMFLLYNDKSMRVVVLTANLCEEGWNHRTQGLWISDKLPGLTDGEVGDSITEFRTELLKYLNAYKIKELDPLVSRISETDFRSINVFFVSSVPGLHDNTRNNPHGHTKVAQLLSDFYAPIIAKCPIIAQSSTLGNYGRKPYYYLQGQIAHSFQKNGAFSFGNQTTLKLIYPSIKNVMETYEGRNGADGLMYFNEMHQNQTWLNHFLYQWRSHSLDRTRALPHIKTYCRYDNGGLYWFFLTSANLTRSAMGSLNKEKTVLKINNYEAGVLFCPRVIINKNKFPMNRAQQRDGDKIFRLPFDVPLVPYNDDDVPHTAGCMQEFDDDE